MTAPATCLWFDRRAEEAARFYVGLFPNSRIDAVIRSAVEWPNGVAGDVLLVRFTLDGRAFQALNGGPGPTFTDAISFSVPCADQAEIDRLWAALRDGGQEVQCGWIKDRFGVSWQIVPAAFLALIETGAPDGAARAMTAMMGMVKLDERALQAAYDGA